MNEHRSETKTELGNVTTVQASMQTKLGNVTTELRDVKTELSEVKTVQASMQTELGNVTTVQVGMQTEQARLAGEVANLPSKLANAISMQESCKASVATQAVAFNGPDGKHQCSGGRIGPHDANCFLTASHCLLKSRNQPDFASVSQVSSLLGGHANDAKAVNVHVVLFSRSEDFAVVVAAVPSPTNQHAAPHYKVAGILAALQAAGDAALHRVDTGNAGGVLVSQDIVNKATQESIRRVRSVTVNFVMEPMQMCAGAKPTSSAAGRAQPVVALTEEGQVRAEAAGTNVLSSKNEDCIFNGQLYPRTSKILFGNSGGVFYQSAIVHGKCVHVPHAIASAGYLDTDAGLISTLPRDLSSVFGEAVRLLNEMFRSRLDSNPGLLVHASELPMWEVVTESGKHTLVNMASKYPETL